MKKLLNINDSYITVFNERRVFLNKEDIYDSSIKSYISLNEDTLDLAFEDEELLDNIVKADMVFCYAEDMDYVDSKDGFFRDILESLNQKAIVLLSSIEEVQEKFLVYIQENYPEIKVSGTMICSNDDTEDAIVNYINNYAPTAVIGLMSSPIQEKILVKHKLHMNTNIIVGFGDKPDFLGYKRVSKGIFKDKNKVKVDIEALEVTL